MKKLILKVWEQIKKIIKLGSVAQLDRATAFNSGASMWKIKKIISKGDYLYALVPDHPNATKNGYVLHHRVIVENHLGRLLNSNEVVHHINSNKKDNRIENLAVLDSKAHVTFHSRKQGHSLVTLSCPWCGKVFVRRKNQTHLVKQNKLNCTCCSKSCRAKLTREIQLRGLTPTRKNAISRNVIKVYKEYLPLENLEETNL